MLSASKLQTAQDADQYYSEIDDYRRESDSAPTRWMGQGATRMGLSGDVQREDFVPLLQGHMPNGQQLQRATAEGSQHAPGWDFTFSAPKSVSVAALVGNDDRLIRAHDRAVESAIGYLEQYGATTRVRTADKGIDEVDTGNLTVATYRHTTSRKTDPQLHTHAVILNATNDGERWRSIDSRALYRIKSEVADVYRAELGRQARELGYQVEHDTGANAGRTGFRLAEVPKDLERDFSQRSQDIEAALGERGKDRESASRAEKQTATLATRDRKQAHEPGALRAQWEATARERGVQTGQLVGRGSPYSDGQSAATASLQEAIAHLSERETRFSERELEITALRFGEGRASRSEIQAAIDDQVKARALIGAKTWSYDPRAGRNNQVDGYTTSQGQQLERRMLDLSRMKPKIAPLADSAGFEEIAAHTESSSGYAWNPSQRAAAHGVITGDHRVSLIQGYAGTAKTTSVIAATAKAADAAGKEFVALAATHTAKDQISQATGKPSTTVAAFLAAQPPGADANQRRVYVVDEASLISTRDMTKLLERTRGAQVLLVGDEKQIGSVQAGAAFRQLQESNRVPVYRLDQVVRQRNEELKSAVYDAADGKPADALRKVKVEEIRADPTADGYEGMSAHERRAAGRTRRLERMAELYAKQTPDQRAETLVITPGRDERDEANAAIRRRLVAQGEVENRATSVAVLRRVDATEAELKKATSYELGHVVVPQRDYKSAGVHKGDRLTVTNVDPTRGQLTLSDPEGNQITWDPRKRTKLSLYEQRSIEVAPGDQLIAGERMTAKSGHRSATVASGEQLQVTAIGDDGLIQARSKTGHQVNLDPAKGPLAVDYGYASTAHAAQGTTFDRVIAHFESGRINLSNQQTLYVAVSRARDGATVVTDDQQALGVQIGRESGQKETATTISSAAAAMELHHN